jgi:hypothetical protein
MLLIGIIIDLTIRQIKLVSVAFLSFKPTIL